jgi:hypothetical protein
MQEKEIDVVQIIKDSFNLVRKDPSIIALYILPAAVLGFCILWIMSMFTLGLSLELFAWIFMVLILYIAASVIMHAAIILKVNAYHQGRKLPITQAVSEGIRHSPRLFLASLAVGIIVFAGLIALIIPGIFLLIRYALVAPACVLNGGYGLKRSWSLTKGDNCWAIVVLLILLTLLSTLIGLIPYVGYILSTLIVGPVFIVSITLFYLLAVST